MGNVPNRLFHLEELSPEEIERRVMVFEKMDPNKLTEDQLEEVVALMAIHRRKTAGPAKPKVTKSEKPAVSFADFLKAVQPAPGVQS